MKSPERYSSLFFLFLGIFIFSQSLSLPFGSLSRPESGFFPSITGGLLIVFSLTLGGRSWLNKGKGFVDLRSGFYGIGVTLVTLACYALFLDALGYVVCTFLAGLILVKIVQKQSWRKSFFVSILYAATSYFGFKSLGIFLPQGIISFF